MYSSETRPSGRRITVMMNAKIAGLLAALLALAGVPAHATQDGRARVMVVGVAHLVARHDVHNGVFQDSPLSPTRQVQIADIVRRLARFHPTKVLIEFPMGDTVVIARYGRYLAGRFTLPADEPYQFGFRLAAAAGDSTIYPIDTWGLSIYDDNSPTGKRIDAYLAAHLADASTPAFKALLTREDALERTGTYLELLRYLNTDAAIRANASSYSVTDAMGRSADEAGTVWVAQWYTRNCYIFANIASVVRPGDRVVILMGQGHEYLLREFVRLDPHFVDVDPLQYL